VRLDVEMTTECGDDIRVDLGGSCGVDLSNVIVWVAWRVSRRHGGFGAVARAEAPQSPVRGKTPRERSVNSWRE